MNTVGHHLYFMSICLASVDGDFDESEMASIDERLAKIQWGHHLSGDKQGDEVQTFNEAIDFYNNTLKSGGENVDTEFMNTVAGMFATFEDDSERPEILSDYYGFLEGVATSDGSVVEAESERLKFIKQHWQL